MTLKEIIKELKANSIEVIKIRATLNGKQVYRVRGSQYNFSALWTADDIIESFQNGEFAQ